uniref:Kin of IRRE-like protein 3 n=1 Tax=Hirondellea gigas TaxID=1518452 RepID=A0A2P2I4K1_9CRUS
MADPAMLVLLVYVPLNILSCSGEVRINPILSSDDTNDTRHTTPAISREPHFAPDSPREVTAALGAPAHIPCKARSLGAKSVSWIRHRDLHVLTVAAFSFTNDDRFTAHRDPSSGDWVLVIRHPKPSDSGLYECSISTKPVITYTVRLNIVVPAAELLGPSEVFLDNGSALNLTCIVKHSPVPPDFVLWYHREQLVNYGRRGKSVDVVTAHSGSTTRSSLLVSNTTQQDSGEYTCKPGNADPATVNVHVLISETPAAMQTTNSSTSLAAFSSSYYSLILLLLPLFALTVLTCPLTYVNNSILAPLRTEVIYPDITKKQMLSTYDKRRKETIGSGFVKR